MPLGEGDGPLVDALTEALEESLVRLARSDRPDWGSALLMGLARLDALEHTRRTGSWVFLDVFPSDAPRISRRRLTRRPDVLGALLRDARRDFETARAHVLRPRAVADGFRELDFAELEVAGNRLVEVQRASRDGEICGCSKGGSRPHGERG